MLQKHGVNFNDSINLAEDVSVIAKFLQRGVDIDDEAFTKIVDDSRHEMTHRQDSASES